MSYRAEWFSAIPGECVQDAAANPTNLCEYQGFWPRFIIKLNLKTDATKIYKYKIALMQSIKSAAKSTNFKKNIPFVRELSN